MITCEGVYSTADALRGYVDEGAPLKSALSALKRDAAALVAKAQGLGATWRDRPDLVEENERLKSRVNEKVAAHEEARERTARAIDATNNGPDATATEQVGAYLSLLSVPLFGLGAYTAEMTLHRYGRFAPKGGPQSRFLSVKSASLWENTQRRLWSKNWIAKPNAAAIRSKWLTVGQWVPVRVGSSRRVPPVSTNGTRTPRTPRSPLRRVSCAPVRRPPELV